MCWARIWGTIITVKVVAEWKIYAILLPAALKICIGIVWIQVMIELIIRVEESTKLAELEKKTRDMTRSFRENPGELLQNMIAS